VPINQGDWQEKKGREKKKVVSVLSSQRFFGSSFLAASGTGEGGKKGREKGKKKPDVAIRGSVGPSMIAVARKEGEEGCLSSYFFRSVEEREGGKKKQLHFFSVKQGPGLTSRKKKEKRISSPFFPFLLSPQHVSIIDPGQGKRGGEGGGKKDPFLLHVLAGGPLAWPRRGGERGKKNSMAISSGRAGNDGNALSEMIGEKKGRRGLYSCFRCFIAPSTGTVHQGGGGGGGRKGKKKKKTLVRTALRMFRSVLHGCLPTATARGGGKKKE